MKTLSLPAGSALPLLVAGAFFMENLDATVIVTALPDMARAFGEHPVDLNIGVSAYILTLTVFIPASEVRPRTQHLIEHPKNPRNINR